MVPPRSPATLVLLVIAGLGSTAAVPNTWNINLGSHPNALLLQVCDYKDLFKFVSAENSRGERITTITLSPSSLLLSALSILLHLLLGPADLAATGLVIAQLLNG